MEIHSYRCELIYFIFADFIRFFYYTFFCVCVLAFSYLPTFYRQKLTPALTNFTTTAFFNISLSPTLKLSFHINSTPAHLPLHCSTAASLLL